MAAAKNPALKKMSFEKLMEEFEQLVKKIEAGEQPLEESIRLFERGMLLAAEGNRRLDDAERRIQVLVEKNGRVEAEPFAAEDAEGE